MKKFLFFSAILILILQSCTDKIRELQQKPEDEKQQEENLADTILTPQEKFAFIMMTDFLNESEDADLASYLEEEIFSMGENFTGAAVIEITPSTWLLSLEKNNTVKNYILQKYIDFKTLESYFTMSETTMKPTEILSKKPLP
ncbi:MAG: hypothetical protein N2510_00045 [Ignavibacteria bacterium]|nr:hypothetical protein [Ignavibacteria bacterium]